MGTRLGMTIEETATPIFANLDKISFWQRPGDRTDFPANRLENGLSNFATNLYSNVEDVSYIKLKTITLGYTLPSTIASRIGVGARIFISAENVFTITNYSGPDPESVDLGNYPLSKRVTLGLTVNF